MLETEKNGTLAPLLNKKHTIEKLKYIKKHGIPEGISLGWPKFDQFYTIPPVGQLNVLTGFPGSGKTEWLDTVAVELAVKKDWKIFYYSPENYPSEFHAQKLCEKFIQKPFDGLWANGVGYMQNVTEKDIELFGELLNHNFEFINCHINTATINQILDTIFEECLVKKINMVVIDPFNKLASQKPSGQSNTDYIGECLTRIQMFSRKYNIQFWIIAHPAKPMKTKDGNVASVSLYDISDSAHWYNMVDNGFIIHRTWEDKIGFENLSTVKIAKIKDNRYGKCGEAKFRLISATKRFIQVDA